MKGNFAADQPRQFSTDATRQATERRRTRRDRGDRIRTCDHRHPIPVRYQTAPLPDRDYYTRQGPPAQSGGALPAARPTLQRARKTPVPLAERGLEGWEIAETPGERLLLSGGHPHTLAEPLLCQVSGARPKLLPPTITTERRRRFPAMGEQFPESFSLRDDEIPGAVVSSLCCIRLNVIRITS